MSKSKGKTNPKKIPRSQKDVDDAYRLGVYKGTEVTLIVFLRSLCDIVDDVDIVQLYDKFESGLDSIRRGDTKLYDEKQAIFDSSRCYSTLGLRVSSEVLWYE